MDQSDEHRGPRRGRPRGRAHPARIDHDDGLWLASDVASFLNVSDAWVYAHASDGSLPSIRLPGTTFVRFEPAAIRAYLKGELPLKTA